MEISQCIHIKSQLRMLSQYPIAILYLQKVAVHPTNPEEVVSQCFFSGIFGRLHPLITRVN